MNYSLQPSVLAPGIQRGKHWARRKLQLSDVTHQETGVSLTNEQMENIAMALAQGQEVLIPGLGYIIPTIAGGTDMDNRHFFLNFRSLHPEGWGCLPKPTN